MLYRGPLYRALNPIYAREPLSGRGAELYGGRFNPKGVPALYSSLTVMTALREANQAGSLQPTTLVSYDAEIADVFDCRDEEALKAVKQWVFEPARYLSDRQPVAARVTLDVPFRIQRGPSDSEAEFRQGTDCPQNGFRLAAVYVGSRR